MCSLYRSSQSYQLKASSLTPSLPETLLPIYRAILRVHRKYFTVMWRELTGLSGLRGGYSSSSYFPAPFLVERERIRKFEKLNLKNRTISFFEIFHSLSWERGLIWTINKYRRVVWTSIYDGYIDVHLYDNILRVSVSNPRMNIRTFIILETDNSCQSYRTMGTMGTEIIIFICYI